MKESKLKRAVIKEELVALTGDYIKAILLNQLIYWSEHMKGVDLFIKEEQERLSNHEMSYGEFECSRGWIYKKAEDLSEETMLNLSHQTVHRNLNQLIEKGFISKRNNPKYKWDRTIQYRVNIAKIQYELNKIGYNLDGYSFSNLDNGMSKMESQIISNGRAIPEITTETTTKTKENIGSFQEKPSRISFSDFLDTTNIKGYESNVGIVNYYLQRYKWTKQKQHPNCTWQEWNDVVVSVFSNDVISELDECEEKEAIMIEAIDQHFQKTFKQYKHDIRSFNKFLNNNLYETGNV
jgi:DNA-binding MarR family transcriptional regulator